MAIKVFADGANLEGMLDMYENGNVQGFTTNPSLMKKGGVTDYRAFAKEVLTHITDVSVSFEVFADDVETMEVEAREIATWAENVYVKIPCVTTKGESTAELVRKLSADGIKVNVTTIFTPAQVDEMVEAVDAETPSIISLFAGRIADTGVDPIPFMTESVKKAAAKPNCEVLWASTRELINILPGGRMRLPDHHGAQQHPGQAQEHRSRPVRGLARHRARLCQGYRRFGLPYSAVTRTLTTPRAARPGLSFPYRSRASRGSR